MLNSDPDHNRENLSQVQPEAERVVHRQEEMNAVRQASGVHLHRLRNMVETETIPDLLVARFEQDSFLDDWEKQLIPSLHADKAEKRHEEQAEGRSETLALDEAETNADTHSEIATNLQAEATEYEAYGQALATTDLLPMNAEKAQEIERFFADHPELELANGVSIEVAKDYGFETAQTDKIWEIAEKLGNPFFHDGAPDMVKLTDPKSRLWLSHLMGLVDGFEEITPTTQFADLPAEEMNALLALYQTTIADQYPHLDVADGNFKWADLRAVSEQVIQSANKKRVEAGTELYAKVIHPKHS